MASLSSITHVAMVALILIIVITDTVSTNDKPMAKTDGAVTEGRTAAHHFAKRMSMLLLPLMFISGVMFAMTGVLTVVSVKSLSVGLLLLIVGLSHVLARIYQGFAPPVTASQLVYSTAPAHYTPYSYNAHHSAWNPPAVIEARKDRRVPQPVEVRHVFQPQQDLHRTIQPELQQVPTVGDFYNDGYNVHSNEPLGYYNRLPVTVEVT